MSAPDVNAAKAGDVVLVRLTLDRDGVNAHGDISARDGDGDRVSVAASSIVSVEPRSLAIGDKVRCRGVDGELKAIDTDTGEAWVRGAAGNMTITLSKLVRA